MKKIKTLFSQKNIFSKLSFFVLLSTIFCSCVPGNDYQDPWDNNPHCRYGNCAPPYGRYGYDQNRYGYDRYGRDPYYDRGYGKNKDRYEDHRPHHSNQTPPRHYDTVPPPVAQPEAVVRPSCPPNTTFDGRHCIVPENRRRSGGKGTINACPKGMWLSGDHCVKD